VGGAGGGGLSVSLVGVGLGWWEGGAVCVFLGFLLAGGVLGGFEVWCIRAGLVSYRCVGLVCVVVLILSWRGGYLWGGVGFKWFGGRRDWWVAFGVFVGG